MKRKNLSLLKLRKSKISNLYKLTKFVGGTDGEAATENALETLLTYCGTCPDQCASLDIKDCITNDTTRGQQLPSLQMACNGLGTFAS